MAQDFEARQAEQVFRRRAAASLPLTTKGRPKGRKTKSKPDAVQSSTDADTVQLTGAEDAASSSVAAAPVRPCNGTRRVWELDQECVMAHEEFQNLVRGKKMAHEEFRNLVRSVFLPKSFGIFKETGLQW